MGRLKRIVFPGFIYHVVNRGNNRDIVFAEEEDYEKYLGLIYRFKKKYDFKLFSYCLMTNHVHLLIKTSEKGSISKIMQSLTVAHTRHFHFKYQRCGHVWQGRFSSPVVSSDKYLLRVMQYIEQNPLRAKMVGGIANYRWSSYKLNIRQKSSKLIDRESNPVLRILGKCDDQRRINYKKLMSRDIEEKDLKKIRLSVEGKGQYISEKFKRQIESLLPRKRRRGRPRKNLDISVSGAISC